MMIGPRELTLEDCGAILRRRIWIIVGPCVLFAISAYILSLFLPSRYTSETVVLVEAPRVPEAFVKPVVEGDVNLRLATMQEQILSRTRLQQIIEKFSLYKQEKDPSMDDKVARLRGSITVSPVRPMAETRASGLPGFTVSVVASQAFLAQQICTEVTSFFMQQNLLLREQGAEETTQFLTAQLGEAKRKLDEQDSKLADYQRRYMGQLPDEMGTNMGLLAGLSSQLDAVSQALDRAQQDKIFVESTLGQQQSITKLPPEAAANPDVLEKQLEVLKNQLAGLQAQYTDNHPDVRKIKKDIVHLEKKIQDETASQPSIVTKAPEKEVVQSPQAQQLRTQLYQIDVTIRQKTAEQAQIQGEIGKLRARLQLTPAVAQEYKSLTRDYQTALNIYNDLLKKQSESEMATDLERRQQGEQFRVLDPPSLPQKPTFPDRPKMTAAGFIGGLVFGLAIAFALEAQDTTLHSERDVERVLRLPTLGMIPLVEAPISSNSHLTAHVQQEAETSVAARVGS